MGFNIAKGDIVRVQDTRYYKMTEPVDVVVKRVYSDRSFDITDASKEAVLAVCEGKVTNPDFFTDEDVVFSTAGAVGPMRRHPASQMFHDVLAEMGEMHDRKQADYGSETDPFANVRGSTDFGLEPWVGAMVRANDKMRRLQAAARGQNLVNESIEDSLIDLAVYAAIGLVLFRQSLEDIGHGD